MAVKEVSGKIFRWATPDISAEAEEMASGGRTRKQSLKLSRIIKRLSRYEALIIDDIGYVQQSREEMEVLFTLLAERYERESVMLTSNLPFSKWEAIFKDPMTTAAAIDRLVHHSVILELNISSYRVEQAQKQHNT
jgi:DNA replication protein DnaC